MSNRTKKAWKSALKEAASTGSASNKHITRISAKPSTERATKAEKDNRAENAVAEDVLNSELVTAPIADPTIAEKSTPSDASSAKNPKTDAKTAQKAQKSKNNLKKDRNAEKPLKEVFILARPFVALGRYLRDSWREIRQVRWPNRGNTWKMTAAVLAYCVVFVIFIMLLDTLFTFLFNLLVK